MAPALLLNTICVSLVVLVLSKSILSRSAPETHDAIDGPPRTDARVVHHD